MAELDIEKNGDGEIKVSPVTGYAVATTIEGSLFVRVEFLEQDLKTQEAVQLLLTPLDAMELGQLLQKYATRLMDPLPGAVN